MVLEISPENIFTADDQKGRLRINVDLLAANIPPEFENENEWTEYVHFMLEHGVCEKEWSWVNGETRLRQLDAFKKCLNEVFANPSYSYKQCVSVLAMALSTMIVRVPPSWQTK